MPSGATAGSRRRATARCYAPPVRILSRYFVGSYLSYYVAILVVSMLVIAVIEMMVNFDDVIEYGEGLAGVASYLFLRLPSYYLPLLLPIGSYVATFLCLGLPARSLEIVAAKTGGISPLRLALPVLATSVLLSGVALLINETIVLKTSNEFNRIARGSDQEVFQARGAFWYQRGTILFSVQEADRDRGILYGVRVYERNRKGRLVRSIQAESAHIEGEGERGWRLENAVFRRFDPSDPDAAPVTEIRREAWLDLGNQNDLALLGADPHTLSLPRLVDYIDALEEQGRDATRYRALLQARLADPVTVFLFALLGVPVGLGVERSRSLAVAALQGIAMVGAYYALQTAVATAGAGGVAEAVGTPWIVLAAFGVFATWRLYRVPS